MSEEEKKEEVHENVQIEDALDEKDLGVMADFDNLIDSDANPVADDDDTDDSDDTVEEEDSAVEDKSTEKEVEKTDDKDEESAEEKAIAAEMEAIEKGDTKEEKPAPEKKEDKTDDKEAEDEYESDLDPEEWDEEVIELDKKRGQQHLEEMRTLKQQNDALQAKLQQQEVQQFTEWADRKFNGLGEEFVEVFGEGDYDDIEPGSEQYENRGKLLNRMNLIAQAYQNLNKPIPSRSKLFDRALQREFKQIIEKPKNQQKTVERLKKRAGQVIGKGAKGSKDISADEKVARAMKDFDSKLDS
jgi:hypothetical protein